jgi:hypothetical protein
LSADGARNSFDILLSSLSIDQSLIWEEKIIEEEWRIRG